MPHQTSIACLRLTTQTIKTLATKAGNLHNKIKSSFTEIENFNSTHDTAIKSIQTHNNYTTATLT